MHGEKATTEMMGDSLGKWSGKVGEKVNSGGLGDAENPAVS